MIADDAAFRMWPLLTTLAANKQTTTYTKLAAAISSHHRHLSRPLGLIQEFCVAEDLPPLTILVTLKGSKVPSSGFTAWDLGEKDAGFQAVWRHSWQTDNPFGYSASGAKLTDLVKKLCSQPQDAAEIYARVRVRGSVQMIFRRSVLQAYSERCAFCGVSFSECLEAAHIVPWNNASSAQRISPTNGICLCANHHRLFDNGYLTISTSGKIIFAHEQDATYSSTDTELTTRLHLRDAHLPSEPKLRPSSAALNSHYQMQGWDEEPWSLKAE